MRLRGDVFERICKTRGINSCVTVCTRQVNSEGTSWSTCRWRQRTDICLMYEVPIAADLPSRRWELRAGLEDLDCSAPSRDDEVSDHDVRVPPSSFPLCVSAETFLDPRPVRPMQACTVSPQGRGLLGLGGRERLRLLLLEKHVVYETAEEGQDRTGLWILTNNSQRSDIIIFCIVGIICGFNLNAPWLLKCLLLQVLNLYVKQRWEKFSHHVDYKTETSRTFTFT